jgi:hypothetical protein
MSYELLLKFINISVLPAWLCLVLLPNWKGTQKLVHSMLYPLVLGGLYIACFAMVIFLGHGAEGGNFTSIDGIRTLFSSDAGIVIGWAHYLVFDLFVGAWEARDAKRRGFNHWLLIPCLFFTFMAGPVGLVLYLLLRAATKKGGWSLVKD